jgi:hypothetical protein
MHAKMRNNDAKASNLHDNESRLNHSVPEHTEKATQLILSIPQMRRSLVLILHFRVQRASYLITPPRPTALQPLSATFPQDKAAEKWVSHTDFATPLLERPGKFKVGAHLSTRAAHVERGRGYFILLEITAIIGSGSN